MLFVGPVRDVVTTLSSAVTLPDAKVVDLGERGKTSVCIIPGPSDDAPTVVLLHGLGATAYLNWVHAFEALSTRFRVVAMDLRGHGKGSRHGRRFRLEDCADDVAAVADALELERFVVVGYSMGGPVAQLVWRRHPDLVDGMVLCATSRNFTGRREEQVFFTALVTTVGALQLIWPASPAAVMEQAESVADDPGPAMRRLPGWAWREFRSTSPWTMAQALSAVGRFSSHRWIGRVDVPTAVVVMTRDHGIPTPRQRKLAAAIPESTVHEVDAGHTACMFGFQRFVPVLVEACGSVADRMATP